MWTDVDVDRINFLLVSDVKFDVVGSNRREGGVN